MFSFHPAFPRGSRRRRSRGAADGRRPRARERRKKCSDRYTCYHTMRCPLGLSYKGALPGSCTPSTPSNLIQARVSRANIYRKSTNRQGKKQAFHSARALAGETSDAASRARRARDDHRVPMRARERLSRSDTGIAPSPRGSRSSRRRRAATRDAAAATNRQTGASVVNRRRR